MLALCKQIRPQQMKSYAKQGPSSREGQSSFFFLVGAKTLSENTSLAYQRHKLMFWLNQL